MPKRFMDEYFLLQSRAARRLFHDHARSMPIFDFHCHLPAAEIAGNRRFKNITEAWLGGDHYKWRAMRACGVPERLITGDASALEKFLAWAGVVPSTIGNPLYHWTHLELARYFGIRGKLLGPDTGREIFDSCTSLLARDDFRARELLCRMGVRVVCTTDDPVDSLEHHALLSADKGFPVTVVPTFRPDRAMALEDPAAFNSWVDRLGKAANVDIRDLRGLIDALARRHEQFHQCGCRLSDYGIETPYSEDFTEAGIKSIFLAARSGRAPSPEEARAFRTAIHMELARMDAKSGWVQQLHIGSLRDVNSRYRNLGPATGFDTIGDAPVAKPLAGFLDRLDAEASLPKTILYCLNPADNAVMAAMIGNFPQENVRGKMQFGSAWWFNDQRHGMEEQMKMLSDLGLLPRFVGMVTDSRSFLSYTRHEYFRRILCNILGGAIERGEAPRDFGLIGGIVRDVCWNNAREYFGIPMKADDVRLSGGVEP